jgi:hypothetical protein
MIEHHEQNDSAPQNVDGWKPFFSAANDRGLRLIECRTQ